MPVKIVVRRELDEDIISGDNMASIFAGPVSVTAITLRAESMEPSNKIEKLPHIMALIGTSILMD